MGPRVTARSGRSDPTSILLAGGTEEERELLRSASFAVRKVPSWDGVLAAIEERRPDLVLLSLPLAPDPERDLVRAIAERHAPLPVVVVADTADERRVVGTLKAGATGYLIRRELRARLVAAVEEALAGGAPLSRDAATIVLNRARRESTQLHAVTPPTPGIDLGERKREILEMLARGLSYDQVALGLGISVNTVRSHVREIYAALGASTKVEAVMIAIENGILKPQ